MRRNEARIQMLALSLLGFFAFLCLDLEPVQAVMDEYGLRSDEAIAEEPAPAMNAVEGPTLAVGGEAPAAKAPQSPCCGSEIALSSTDGERVKQLVEQFASQKFIHTAGHVAQEELGELPTFVSTSPRSITSTWLSNDRPTWTSLGSASKELSLAPEQVASWERTIEDAQSDLDDLRHVPNGDGVSWHSITRGARKDRGDLTKALSLAHALADFMTSELNGGETFTEARSRLLTSYKDRLRADLTPEQAKVFDARSATSLLDPARLGLTMRIGLTKP